jgi:hypothetical protein
LLQSNAGEIINNQALQPKKGKKKKKKKAINDESVNKNLLFEKSIA